VHDVPIYAQLISERGDIPLQARNEARRIQRELEWIINADPASGGRLPKPPAAPGPGPRSLPPGSGSTGWLN
jgi:hypothetical protein